MYRIVAAFFVLLIISSPVCATILDVEADTITKAGDRIQAAGNVVVTGKGTVLNANYVVYDTLTEDLWASGNCRLVEEKGEMKAQTMYYNARRQDIQLENGSIFVYSEPLIISGESITRYGQDYYVGENVEYTPCLGSPPAWSMGSSSLEIPVEGYAQVWHTRFMIHQMPVLYIPYLLYPAKLERQSGLLFPQISHGSDYGYRYGIPAYIVLGRSADLTITPMQLTKRGLLITSQFRYRLDYAQSGEIYLESLRDKYGGEETEGGMLETVPDRRWYLKAKQTGGALTWDINLVSNEDYFRDIGSFYGDEQYFKATSTEEDESDSEELISRMQWYKSENGFSVSLSGQWKQDLTVEGDDQTFQEVPKLKARMNQRGIPYTPLKYSSEVSTTRVYSLDWIEAIKNNALFELSLPMSAYPYFTLRPYVEESYRDTFITDRRDVYADGKYLEHWQKRGVSVSTALYSPRSAGGWYHQIAPNVSWAYKSRIGGNYDSSDSADIFPNLLSGDDWVKAFDMQLALDNYIRDASGKSILDFSIGRKYSYITKEWEYFEARVRFKPYSWFSAKHTNSFGRLPLRAYATQEHSSELKLSDERGDEIYISEEYNRIDTKSIIVGTKIALIWNFSARFETEHDYILRRYDYSRQGLVYDSQCWSIDLYREARPADELGPRETTIYLNVNLLGLGDVVHTSQTKRGDFDIDAFETMGN